MHEEFPKRDLIKLALLDLLWKQERHQIKAAESYRPLAKAVDLNSKLAKSSKSLSDELAPTWSHHVQWAGQELAMEGYIENYIPHGIWKLTDKGAKTAETLARVCAPL